MGTQDESKWCDLARCNVCRFEQIPHMHYDPDSKLSPMTTPSSAICGFHYNDNGRKFVAWVIDVKGAFLKGKFASKDEVLLLEVPQGFKWVYDKVGEEMERTQVNDNSMNEETIKQRTKEIFQEWLLKSTGEKLKILREQKKPRGGAEKVFLKMQRTIYGSVQAARAFWIELQQAFKAMGYSRREADPCLYFKWDEQGELCMWLTWIDDCVVIGKVGAVAKESAKLMSLFKCKDIGPMEEYAGSKVEINGGKMKFKQPVLLQSFVDEFGVDAKSKVNLQAALGQVRAKGEDHEIMDGVMRTKYRLGDGKLRFLATWSRLDILNAVREVSWHMQAPTKKHYEAMIRVMAFCIATPERGHEIEPDCKWDGTREFEFQVSSKSNLTYNQCPETRKSVLGNMTELNGVPIIVKSIMQVVSYGSRVRQCDNQRTGYAFCATDCGKPGIESKNTNEIAGG
jgi:Reverse transcriptase (RNA-dependent DNA polymerase)